MHVLTYQNQAAIVLADFTIKSGNLHAGIIPWQQVVEVGHLAFQADLALDTLLLAVAAGLA